MKNRVHWIDIAKGLMIIGMVLNHIPNLCARQGVDLSHFPWWVFIGGAYGVFTMQSFFILSGYTSNFDQEPSIFIKKQIKGLIIPYISFSIICYVFAYLVWDEPFYYDSFGEYYFFLVDSYWFLTALFIAKVLVFLLHRISNKKVIQMGGAFLLLLIGFTISECYIDKMEPTHYHNWFHYRNGLCMTVFVILGYYFKHYKVVENHGFKFSFAYVIIYYMTLYLLLKGVPASRYFAAPSYTHYFVPNISQVNGYLMIPSYLFYTTIGSILVFWIAQKISKWSLMEYLGKTSLVIYCIHFTFLKVYIIALAPFFDVSSFIRSAVFFIILALFTIASSALVTKLFEYKPWIYLIGKF